MPGLIAFQNLSIDHPPTPFERMLLTIVTENAIPRCTPNTTVLGRAGRFAAGLIRQRPFNRVDPLD